MSVTGFSFPTAIRFGAGARQEVAKHLQSHGVKRPLIVTDKALASLPVLAEFSQHEKPAPLRILSIGFADSRGNVEEFVKADPYVSSGLVTSWRIERWSLVS